MGPDESTVSEYGTWCGSPADPEAEKPTIESGGTDTRRGTTDPDDRPGKMVAVTVTELGLARSKVTDEPGPAVVWANRHTADRPGEPSRSESPPPPPTEVCWNSELTSTPAWALTKVAMSDARCT